MTPTAELIIEVLVARRRLGEAVVVEALVRSVRRWWLRRRVRRACPAGAAVARRGIVVGSAHADRGTDSGRFPEKARIHALATVRRAMARTASKDVTHE